ncbi:hypothetical protein SMKC057_12510 [Serratia marcescens]|nr:hypothetical protein SMKC057_12510 [Serratia marcescens]
MCSFEALKDGRLDLFDVVLMNDYLDMKADNEARIARWREDQ